MMGTHRKTVMLFHLDKPLYLLGYLAAQSRVDLIDRWGEGMVNSKTWSQASHLCRTVLTAHFHRDCTSLYNRYDSLAACNDCEVVLW
jgi:hypothetical protein